MSSQTPSVVECALIFCSSSKHNHHSCCWPCLTKSSRVVDSDTRAFSTWILFLPRKWSFIYVQHPTIIHGLSSSISAKDQQKWLWENNGVTIPPSWSLANNWDNHPLGLVLPISEIKQEQIIRGKRPTSSCSSIDNHLELIDRAWTMGSSWWWSNSLSFQLWPLIRNQVQTVSVVGDDVTTCISCGTSEQDTFLLVD